MERRIVTIDEIIATFSSHVSEHYPSPKDFRRNFDMLLKGKRERADGGAYSVSLERNVVFLSSLVSEGDALIERFLKTDSGEEPGEGGVTAVLEGIEKKAHERTARLHGEAFVEGRLGRFEELRADRAAGGAAYVDKLEFNYRYLMTMRIFMFEFVSILAAVRSQYSIAAEVDAARKIKSHLELTAHYYLGNVTVDGSGGMKAGEGEHPG
ncbi:MAG: hypothetical protein PHD74_01995 [Candidatus Krumholzibacteria bacterium]|nr:hypothetical protein [Candidatus Krumholzibacteria bacterium]